LVLGESGQLVSGCRLREAGNSCSLWQWYWRCAYRVVVPFCLVGYPFWVALWARGFRSWWRWRPFQRCGEHTSFYYWYAYIIVQQNTADIPHATCTNCIQGALFDVHVSLWLCFIADQSGQFPYKGIVSSSQFSLTDCFHLRFLPVTNNRCLFMPGHFLSLCLCDLMLVWPYACVTN